MPFKSIHVAANGKILFSLWLSSIILYLLYICIYIYIYITYACINIQCIDHMFFIYSYVDGHLCCFPFFTILSNVAMNIEIMQIVLKLIL